MMKKIYTEITFFIVTNILFYSLIEPIQKIVKSSFYTYGNLNIESTIKIIVIILLMIVGVTGVLLLILKKYQKLSVLSVFNMVTSVFWIILLVATMDYSLGWNRFHTAEEFLILSFYVMPLVFVMITLIYKKKFK